MLVAPSLMLPESYGGLVECGVYSQVCCTPAVVGGDIEWQLICIGNGLNVLKVMPESAIKFGSYEFAKRLLAQLEGHNDPTRINPYSKFIAGGAGGLISQ